MDHDAKSKFILALHKRSLESFDSGGMAGSQSSGAGGFIGTAGGFLGDVSGALTKQNQYNANLAPTQNYDYGSHIDQAAGNAFAGYGQHQNIQAQQQALANQLQALSLGQGPNPAQAALAQATGQNVQQQAALMAGQRGAGANAGMIARQAAQQGAGIQQNAAGQAATLQAQQQLAAQSALAQQQGIMGQQNIAEQGVNANLYGTAAGANNTQNSNNIQNYSMAQGINSQVSQNNANSVNKTQAGILGGLASAAGPAGKAVGGLFGFAKGGMVSRYADGGNVGMSASVSVPNISNADAVAASYKSGDKKSSSPAPGNPLESIGGAGSGEMMAGGPMDAMGAAESAGPLLMLAADGGDAGGPMSHVAKLLKHGKFVGKMEKGGKVQADQGQKAVKSGNSYANDKVPALLSEGEIVIPRSITMQPMAAEKAAAFVQAALNKRKMGKK